MTANDPLHSHPSNVVQSLVDRATGPLAGMIVADFGRVLAAPYCTMLLADLGATVIKIESPAGDETRAWRPPVRDDEATYFLALNRNKLDIALDLKQQDDLRIAREIIARADVVVDNFKPGGMRALGLDPEQLRDEFPGLVTASVTGFGTEGGRALPGYDLLVQAVSGHMSITGDSATRGFKSGVAIFDVVAGLHSAVGILASLLQRQSTGEGQRVETDLLSVALSALANQTSAWVAGDVRPERMGNEHPSIFPYAPFPSADGEVVIAIGNDRQFAAFAGAIGHPELLDDPRFATAPARSVNRDALRPVLESALRSRTSEEWFEALSPLGVPCGPLQDVPGGVAFAERLGLEPVVEAGRGDRAVPVIRNPVRYSGFDVGYELPPPTLDEHRAAVLEWIASTAPRESGRE